MVGNLWEGRVELEMRKSRSKVEIIPEKKKSHKKEESLPNFGML